MIAGASIGALAGLGLVGIVLAIRSPHPSLMARVAPYVPERSIGHDGRLPRPRFGPGLRRAGDTLGRLIGGAASLERRLDRLGWEITVAEFRARQVIAGGAGLAAAFAFGLWLATSRSPSPIALIVLCVVGFVGGVVAYDSALSRRLSVRETRQAQQFPAVAELLSLAVASGESPSRALERVIAVSHGDLTTDLRRVVADIHAGAPFVEAFDALAARTGVPVIARFAESLAVAVERGTPLIDVLHAQAGDVRESARRDLIEGAAGREVLMMIPVVFLLMPTTVVIAFYPGFVGLSLGPG